jgi:hypothetical protein
LRQVAGIAGAAFASLEINQVSVTIGITSSGSWSPLRKSQSPLPAAAKAAFKPQDVKPSTRVVKTVNDATAGEVSTIYVGESV